MDDCGCDAGFKRETGSGFNRRLALIYIDVFFLILSWMLNEFVCISQRLADYCAIVCFT